MSKIKSFRGVNHELMRQQNLSGILHHLHEKAPISRAELAKLIGLNKATVSSLISELIDSQFVYEVGVDSLKRSGRRSVLLKINPARGCIVSGEIGADFVSIICTNFAAEIVWSHRERIRKRTRQASVVERTQSLMKEATEIGRNKCGQVVGVVLGAPGLVDRRTGELLFAPNLGWKNVPLGEMLRQSFSTMAFVDNEANLGALGEQYFGKAKGYDEVLYISAGVGLGGGVVHEGKLMKGSTGFAGEFGHMTMDPRGELCGCGNRGCWETQVSQSALFRHIKESIETGASSVLNEMVSRNPLTVPKVVEAARNDDHVALAALKKVGRDLGIGIASLVNALNPRLVVFGGILSLAGEFLLPVAREELRARALRWVESDMQIELSRFGLDSCVMGGVAKVYQSALSAPVKLNGNKLHPLGV